MNRTWPRFQSEERDNSEMVYCVLVRLLQRAYALCTIQLAIYALFSLNVLFKIWPTNEALRFSKNQHSGVEKQSLASQKMIEKKKGE